MVHSQFAWIKATWNVMSMRIRKRISSMRFFKELANQVSLKKIASYEPKKQRMRELWLALMSFVLINLVICMFLLLLLSCSCVSFLTSVRCLCCTPVLSLSLSWYCTTVISSACRSPVILSFYPCPTLVNSMFSSFSISCLVLLLSSILLTEYCIIYCFNNQPVGQ